MILASNARARLNGFHDHARDLWMQYLAREMSGVHVADRDPPFARYGFREIALKGGQLVGDGQVSVLTVLCRSKCPLAISMLVGL
jgi:hypothetical protein